MNVITRLEYELAYYDSAVHRFNHYTTRTPPVDACVSLWASPSSSSLQLWLNRWADLLSIGYATNSELNRSVGWDCRLHGLYLYSGCKTAPSPDECPWYNTKQSDRKVSGMLELWGMWSTPSLALLPCQLWPGVVAPDKAPVYGSNKTKLCTYAKLNCLIKNCFDIWTVHLR